MRWAGIVIGLLAAAAGAIWILQGLNVPFAPRSFMTADRAWIVIGAATVVGGLGLAAWSARRPGQP